MSHSTNARTNIQQKHPTVNSGQYLHDNNESRDVIFTGESTELVFERVENSSRMRINFRQLAQRPRSQHSYNHKLWHIPTKFQANL
jgi:hypothetical protein